MAADISMNSMSEIQSFFKNTSVFITGATGFLGHVLLAKLLKSCPDIKRIYVLLRSKKGKTVQERFQDMLQDEVFSTLKLEYGEQLKKVQAVAGDCLEPKLGLREEDMELLKNEINVVFHVAATVRFDAPLKYAVHMNIRSTSDLLDMAYEMKQLKSFVHVSTAFSNCVNREVVEEKFYQPPILAEKLMILVDNLDDTFINRITPSLLGNYPNTYIFTKAVAENLCKTKGIHLPLTVFRPAIVISTSREPIPGWINNVYGPTGVVAAAAVGLLHILLVDRNSKANVVPCDYVVNATIASAWNIGTRSSDIHDEILNNNNTIKINEKSLNGKMNENIVDINNSHQISHENSVTAAEEYDSRKIPVYNYTCDLLKKPFTWKEFMKLNVDQEPLMPSSQSIWIFSLILTKNKFLYQLFCLLFHIIPAFFADTVAKLLRREPKLLDAYQKLHKLAEVLAYFSTQEWKITNDNVLSLWNELSEKDKQLFDFNLNNIDWQHYYYEHCVGIRRFILKEDPDTIPYAKKRRILLSILHYTLISVVSFTSLFVLLKFAQFLI